MASDPTLPNSTELQIINFFIFFLVAMTRPKRQLCIIGDSETVGRYAKCQFRHRISCTLACGIGY